MIFEGLFDASSKLFPSAFGSSTVSPCVSIGAVTMKMISSTSITSTSGVTLISERSVGSSVSVGRRISVRRTSSACGYSREVPLRQIQKVHRKVLHLPPGLPKALDEHVVGEEGGDGGEEAGGGVDERFADAGGDGDDRRGAGGADGGEGVHDSPHGAEEADERRRRGGRGQKGGEAAQARRLDPPGAPQRAFPPVQRADPPAA